MTSTSSTLTINRYSPERAEEWDAFVRLSRNGVFLFLRGYMDYHRDRFADHSLMFYSGGRLLCLLPATEREGALVSHGGLTYGGLVMGGLCTARKVIEVFQALMNYLRGQGFAELIYKPVPHIYHRQPSETDLYALESVCHARLSSRKLSATLRVGSAAVWRKGKRSGAKAALRNGVRVGESDDLRTFHGLLCSRLQEKYAAEPVHSLAELQLLKGRFPQNIRLLMAEKDGEALAGALLYITDTCVHIQYMAASDEGLALHAADALVWHLQSHCRDFCPGAEYLDYGTSMNPEDGSLNVALMSSKEGYGFRGTVYDTYTVTV